MIKLEETKIKNVRYGSCVFVTIHKETKAIINLVELSGMHFEKTFYYWQSVNASRDRLNVFEFDLYDYYIFDNMQEFCTWYLKKKHDYEFFDKNVYVNQWKTDVTNSLNSKLENKETVSLNDTPLDIRKPSKSCLKIGEGYEKKGGINTPPIEKRPEQVKGQSGYILSRGIKRKDKYTDLIGMIEAKILLQYYKHILEEHTRPFDPEFDTLSLKVTELKEAYQAWADEILIERID